MWSPKALVARWRRPYEAVAKDDPETAAEAETPPAAQPSPPKPPKRRSDSDLADLERNARAINVLCALHFVNFASLHLTSLPYFRRADLPKTGRGDAVAETGDRPWT